MLEPSGDFAKALAKLEASVGIHGAMKKGFGALYGYSSDEKGGLGTLSLSIQLMSTSRMLSS
jgi:hypothetical protein